MLNDLLSKQMLFVEDDEEFSCMMIPIFKVFVKEVCKSNDEIPIIILSGYKDEELLLKVIPLGLTDYLIIILSSLKPLKNASIKLLKRHIKQSFSVMGLPTTLMKKCLLKMDNAINSKRERFYYAYS